MDRHCALVGERAPADDVMNSVVRFSLLTGKVPRIEGTLGFFDFKDVEIVAYDIAHSVSSDDDLVSYQHHSSNSRVPFDRFGRRMSEVYGKHFEEVSPGEWLQASAECGMQELLVIHLRANMESADPLVFPYLGV
ncbi:uncharacterized protein RCC_11242 [Ramularia collo-cygni]|uniref:Uncharacterized protein n=1 Tax=Ramularia collo-cygni TaxID=112498 RepID=A0A2D3VNF3_9PEZI|nr:uncharacterized protein RCC_11242 [Ramularia collo-cygni]CZT25509.1 uncharacterized protein RCC_11242 [Ramularia collo-cygni]